MKTMSATSLSIIASRRADPRILDMARASYGEALRDLNAAIGHTDRRLDDETLIAIPNMELLTELMGDSAPTASSHLRGCQQLLELRLQSQIGSSELTQDFIDHVVIKGAGSLLDDYSHSFQLSLSPSIHHGNAKPATQILLECANVGRLRMLATDMANLSRQMLRRLLAEGLDIDARLEAWPSTLPAGAKTWLWHHSHWMCKDPTCAFTKYYCDLKELQTWNNLRCARILLWELLLRIHALLLSISPRYSSRNSGEGGDDAAPNSALVARGLRIVDDMLTDICNSIPFHTKKMEKEGGQLMSSTKVLAWRALVRPLKTVLNCERSRRWHKTQARGALYKFGMQNAKGD